MGVNIETQKQNSAVNGADDREAYSKFWIAFYTKPCCEKKSARELSKSGIEIYIPLQVQIHKWSDRRKKVEVPIIPMVVFAKVNESQMTTISQYAHVIKIISQPGEKKAARIPEIQINNLKFILGQSDTLVEFDSNPFRTDDTVEVIRGYFKGLKGKIHECSDGTTELIVRIDLFGGAKLKINKQDLIHIQA